MQRSYMGTAGLWGCPSSFAGQLDLSVRTLPRATAGVKDRARFYECALGSARESRDWYWKGRHILGPQVTEHRMELLTQIVRLLLTMIPQQRGRTIRDQVATYETEHDTTELDDLLTKDIPFA